MCLLYHGWCLLAILILTEKQENSLVDAYFASNLLRRQFQSTSFESFLNRPSIHRTTIWRYQRSKTFHDATTKFATKATVEIAEDAMTTAVKTKSNPRTKNNTTKSERDDAVIVESTKKRKSTTTPDTLAQKSSNKTLTNKKINSLQQQSHWLDSTDEVIYQEVALSAFGGSRITTIIVDDDDDNATIINETEAAATISATTTVPSLFHCTIRGNPLPLRRHRTRLGFVYNPSAASQLTFRTSVLEIINLISQQQGDSIASSSNSSNGNTTTTQSPSIDGAVPLAIPLWDIEQPIAVSIVFRMKRPNSHFIGNKPFAVESTTKNKSNKRSSSHPISRLRISAPKTMCTTSIRTDIDNLAKFVLDSLNNVTYVDDRQIVSLHVMKLYDNDIFNQYRGSTTVTIRLLTDMDMTTLLLKQELQQQ